MYYSLVVTFSVIIAYANAQGHGYARGGGHRGGGEAGFEAGGAAGHRAGHQQAQEAGSFDRGGARVEEAHDLFKHRASILAAGENVEAAEYHMSRASEGAGGVSGHVAGGSAGGSFGAGHSSAVAEQGGHAGSCGGVPFFGKRYLCCGQTFYGDTFDELGCCGSSIFDTRFYGCSNNVLAPLYRPLFNNPANFNGVTPVQKMCGDYVWQVYNEPYELCCEGVHYPNPYGYYGCCGPRCFDSRYYYCGHDAESKSFRVYRRTTYLLAATEETEIEVLERKVVSGAEGGSHASGVASGGASGGGHQHAAGGAAHGMAAGGGAAGHGHQGGHHAGGSEKEFGGQDGHGYNTGYHQYYGAGLPYNSFLHSKK